MRPLVAFALVAVCAAPARAQNGDLKQEIEELKRAHGALEEKIRRQEAEIESLRLKLASARGPGGDPAEARELERSIDELVAASKDALRWKDLSASASKLRFYGHLRLDAIYDDSRPSNTQTIGWVLSEDGDAPPGVGAGGKNRSDLTIHPRLTRLGLDVDGGTISALGNAAVTGKLEIDFYNSGLAGQSESRSAIRMRHAWAKLAWGDFSVLAGQTADVISPLYPVVNPDLVMWGAGNLGDRRPQFRPEFSTPVGEGRLLFQGEIGLTGADDNQDLDSPGSYGAGYRDGETSGLPTLQARTALRTPILGMKDLEAGLWVHRAWENPDERIAGETRFDSEAYGFDVTIPIHEDVVWLKGEGFAGTNVDDVRGGIFQGINRATGDTIDSMGGWIEVSVKPVSWYTVSAGYSTDDPDNDDLAAGGRAANKIWYLGNRFRFSPVEFGIDYLHWTTEYVGFSDGTDNRVQAYVSYQF